MHLEQIRWQCRRGMLELELLLLRFLETTYKGLSPDDKGLFVELLEESDQTLYQWFLGHVLSPPKFVNLVNVICKKE